MNLKNLLKLKLLNRLLVFIPLFFIQYVISQNDHAEGYLKYIDSASSTVDNNHKIAEVYLDSIPEPLHESIKGHIACYYELKVLVNDKKNERAELFKNSLLALKYAKLEKNYNLAGWASLEIFYNSYIVHKDSSSYQYIENAEKFYTLSNDKNGLADVSQMRALVKLNDKDYSGSNKLLLSNLENYRGIKDDAYYHMYALFLLTTNYIYSDSLGKAHKYLKTLKSLENNTTIPSLLFKSHLVTVYCSLGESHFKKNEMDSTLFYLSKSNSLKNAMTNNDKRDFFNLYIDYYDYNKNFELKNSYLDSLRNFEDQVLKKTMDASIGISNALMKSESDLGLEKTKTKTNRLCIIVLLIVLIMLYTLFFIKQKRSKEAANNFQKNNDELSYLKSNHEKLKVKTHGLEQYITDVKKEVKSILSIDENAEQRKKINEFYKKIHLNASLLLDRNEDHLKIVNELNIDFFTKINNKYPQLNDSDIVVCYYLYVGFKSKEIAVFLKSTTRAIEGRRYRIKKKLNLQDSEYTLHEFLNMNFEELNGLSTSKDKK